MNLNTDTGYLRATLREAMLDLNVRQNVSLHEAMRNSRVIEAVLLLLDKVEALEGKKLQPPPEPTTTKFEDRSFIVVYGGHELCLPEHRQQAEAAGYEVVGTFQLQPGKPYFKLARRPL